MSAALLATSHADQVRVLSRRMAARSRGRIEAEDLAQDTLVALLEMRVDPDHTADHQQARALARARGAMIDTARQNDDCARSVRAKIRSIATAECRLEQTLGRRPRDAEIATAANLDLDDYFRVVAESRGAQMRGVAQGISECEECERLDEVYLAQHGASHFANPLELMESAEVARCLTEAVEALPRRWHTVVAAHHIQGRRYVDIAAEMGISESRVCQIHKEAVERIRDTLRERGFL